MLALLETVGASPGGMNIENIVSLAGMGLTLTLYVFTSNQRASKEADRRHELARAWAELTFVRKDVYESDQEPLTKKVDRIEAIVELIYRYQQRKPGPGDERDPNT